MDERDVRLMKKLLVVTCLLLVISMVSTSCGRNIKNQETVNSEEKQLSSTDYKQLVGNWLCVEEENPKQEVSVEKNRNGLIIQYDNGEKVSTEYVSKTEELNSTHYRFENKKAELGYFFTVKENGHIILNRGTTNPKVEGISKPTEYKRNQ